ncbi:MAG: PAS domain-containing protein [Flaviramulus sp.]|nr:LuxR C-terminal-related transcriptional regulator [Flaviramulus sp.]NNC50426.1 PAS domain-containing protein [Flaviramulus sp.]
MDNLFNDSQNSNGTPQNFNELLNFPIMANKQCMFVVDWKKSKVIFTQGILNMLGYSEIEFNQDTILNNIHPEDTLLVNRIINTSVELSIKANIKKGDAFLTKSFRLQKSDGTYLKVLSQSSPFQSDENGDLISFFTILTDISFMETRKLVEWEVYSEELNIPRFKKKIYYDFLNLFSKRELEIIRFIKQDFTSKEIALKIFISPHTVVSHRKNIFNKSNCHSIKELIAFVDNNGIV